MLKGSLIASSNAFLAVDVEAKMILCIGFSNKLIDKGIDDLSQ